jgi:hypothetical protein
MESINAFTGVGNGVAVSAVGMSRTLPAAAAHPAFWAHAAVAGAAAITPPRKRRAAATGPSVDRGFT